MRELERTLSIIRSMEMRLHIIRLILPRSEKTCERALNWLHSLQTEIIPLHGRPPALLSTTPHEQQKNKANLALQQRIRAGYFRRMERALAALNPLIETIEVDFLCANLPKYERALLHDSVTMLSQCQWALMSELITHAPTHSKHAPPSQEIE